MLLLGYMLVHMWEFLMGMYIVHAVYPVMRTDHYGIKALGVLLGIIVTGMYAVNAWDSYISNIFIPFYAVLVSGLYCMFYRAKVGTTCLILVIFGNVVALVKVFFLGIYGILTNHGLAYMIRGDQNWWKVICVLTMNMIMTYVFLRKKRVLDTIKRLVEERLLWIFLMALLQWCMLSYNMYLVQYKFQTTDLVMNALFLICLFLAIQYILLFASYKENAIRNNLQDTVQNITITNMQFLQEQFDSNNRKMHDIKHHLLFIASCLERMEFAKAQKSIMEYLDYLGGNTERVWSGFSFFDYILNYKKREAEEKKICVEYKIEIDKYPFAEEELGVILGNLLDNAIEAAENCEERKWIYLEIRNLNDMFWLSLRNGIATKPQEINGKFVTIKKKNKIAHGIGVESVKRIVTKYEGNIEFQYDNEQFEVNILV